LAKVFLQNNKLQNNNFPKNEFDEQPTIFLFFQMQVNKIHRLKIKSGLRGAALARMP